MKRKLLITLVLAAVFACMLAVMVSAAGPKDLFSEVTILDNINKTTTFGYGETDFARVVLEDPDSPGTYVTYPTYYVFDVRYHSSEGDQPKPNYDYLKNATGKQYSHASIICIEFCEEFTGASTNYTRTHEMTNLQYVKFSKSLKVLHASAFKGLTKLSVIEFQNNTAEGAALNIGSYAFDNCDALVSVELPIQLKTIGERGFGDNDNLVSVTFAKGTDFTLYNADGTIKANNLYAVFINDIALKSLIMPEGITSTGYLACGGCTSLEYVYIPASCKAFEDETFNNCKALTTIEFAPNCQLETIGRKAIAESSNLTSITFPNTFLTAGGEAPLRNLQNLTYVNFGASFVGFTGYASMYSTNNSELVIVLSTTFDIAQYAKELPSNAVILYTGTEKQAEAFGYSTTMSYESWVAAGSPKGKKVVFGYNMCDAFYKGDHEETAVSKKFVGQAYLSNFVEASSCERCLKNFIIGDPICGALFDDKGYSRAEDYSGFTYGISPNRSEIEKYEKSTGNKISYGFIVGLAGTENEAGKIIDKDENALISKAIVANLTEIKYQNLNIYNVKMTGVEKTEQIELEIYCNAYVIENESVAYIGAVSETGAPIPVTVKNMPAKKD